MSQSTPSSPRLLPRRVRDLPDCSGSAVSVSGSSVRGAECLDVTTTFGASTSSSLQPAEINWKERCLELQMELHRNRTQATRTRDMLREKVSCDYV